MRISTNEVNALNQKERIQAFEDKFVKTLPDGSKKFSFIQLVTNLREIITLILALIANFKK